LRQIPDLKSKVVATALNAAVHCLGEFVPRPGKERRIGWIVWVNETALVESRELGIDGARGENRHELTPFPAS
jgi:hypothetical protein